MLLDRYYGHDNSQVIVIIKQRYREIILISQFHKTEFFA